MISWFSLCDRKMENIYSSAFLNFYSFDVEERLRRLDALRNGKNVMFFRILNFESFILLKGISSGHFAL